jgi:hypothetical protein
MKNTDKNNIETNKELEVLSAEEFIEKLKADANAELYGNVDEPIEEDNDKQKTLDDFAKFTKLIRKYKKIQTQLKELELYNKDNEELQKYIKYLHKLDELTTDIDVAKKGYMYDSAILTPDLQLENKDVKLSITLPYEKEEFNKDQFKKDYEPDSEMYQKYITTKSVKGNIKYTIKED